MNSKEVANLTGVSIRTLHYYEELGLLHPQRSPGNDYREYSEEDLDLLQQILFFKACGFSLQRIREIMQSEDFDREEAFLLQKKALLFEKERIERMIHSLEKSLSAWKGDKTMSQEEKFEGFNFEKNPYEQEARERWGDEAVESSEQSMKKLGKEGRKALEEDMNALFENLAKIRHEDPQGEKAQEEIDKMYTFFNARFGHYYSYEMFGALGQMYVEDARFQKNIDRFGEGLSEFLAKAMSHYAVVKEEK